MLRSLRLFRITKYIIYKETNFDFHEIIYAFIGSFIGISLLGSLQNNFVEMSDSVFLIGSFGATSVLIFGIPNSQLARPRNVIGGHFFSAIVGVSIFKIFGGNIWFAAALGVACSIVVMQITKTLHPPGGATSLLACIGSSKIIKLGYLYVFSPVLFGSVVLVGIALLTNKFYQQNHWNSITKPFR